MSRLYNETHHRPDNKDQPVPITQDSDPLIIMDANRDAEKNKDLESKKSEIVLKFMSLVSHGGQKIASAGMFNMAMVVVLMFLVVSLTMMALFLHGTTYNSLEYRNNGNGIIQSNPRANTTNNKTRLPRTKSVFLTKLDSMINVKIEDPSMLSNLPDSPEELFLSIMPRKHENWGNVNISIPRNVRAIEFQGRINPKSVRTIATAFQNSITHLVFSFDNILCDEFDNYKDLGHDSKVDIKSLFGIRLAGDTNCANVFDFITSEISLQQVVAIELESTHILYNNAKSIQELFQQSQNTLEYIYLRDISACTNCSLFGTLNFPKLRYAGFVFNLGINISENAQVINQFSSNVPQSCRATNPDENTFVVQC